MNAMMLASVIGGPQAFSMMLVRIVSAYELNQQCPLPEAVFAKRILERATEAELDAMIFSALFVSMFE